MKLNPRHWRRVGVIICGFLACTLCASLLMAKPGVVKTKDGRSIEGDVTEEGDTVSITVHGIATSIPRESIDSIQYTGSIDQQYQDKLANLPKNASANDHLDLARWLMDNRAYTLAMREVTTAQHLDPNNTDAATMEQTIEGQIRLEHSSKPAPQPSSATPTPGPSPANPPANPSINATIHRYLNNDQIQEVRQAEWSPDDTSIRISFTNDVRHKYIVGAQENATTFMNQPVIDQAKAILSNGTPEERKDVKILTDPVQIATYKRVIQPVILSGCATAACHGGAGGKKFFLYGSPNSDAAIYTNYYLLMTASFEVDGVKHLMIDRDYPKAVDKSLISAWGLPSEITKLSHPPVKGVPWRPLFKDTQDPQYIALENWMSTLMIPAPKYDFTFSLTAPASAPTSGAR